VADLAEAVATLPGVRSASVEKGEVVAHADRGVLLELMTTLRDDPRFAFEQVMDICGVDWPERAERFDVVYNLLSVSLNQRARIIVTTNESLPVPSVCEIWPDYVYQWHREGFELPHGAELLAEGDIFRVQALRYGPAAYGIQFHAEVTHAMMCRWTTRGHARMELPGAKQRAAHFAERPVYDPAIRTWLATFLERWVEGGTVGASAAATP